MIKPSVGRIVNFFLDKDQKEPFAAIITKVIRDDLIYVTVFAPMNVPEAYIDIPINRDVKQCPCAEWMEYQKGQAQKTSQLEQQLKEKEEKELSTYGKDSS